MTHFNIPTILVVFGATGDLMRKKIIPALFYSYVGGSLPKVFQVVAYSRRPLSDDEFRQDHILPALERYYAGERSEEQTQAFLSLFSYQQGTFEQLEDYQNLKQRLTTYDNVHEICTNKLYYLSVPPTYYEQIFDNLKVSGLTDPCGPEEGWTRVLVEKPFGDDEETARRLDERLATLFKEEQIYRIDHYLAKEMLQNVLTFRFSNNLFEQVWNNESIERIDIRLLESIGVEDRGSFYDGVGALRDVGQNHVLQMLALVTMDNPVALDAGAIRTKRAEAIREVAILSPEEVKNQTFRAQYDGYQEIKGVEPGSQTETYFKMQTSLTAPRWQGVPVTLEAGKRMGQALKEMTVTFRHPMPCLCPPDSDHHLKNKIVFQLEPTEGITVHFWAKKPGFDWQIEERSLDFALHGSGPRVQYVTEYAKLLLDAIRGDQTLFISTEEVRAMWRVIDPVVRTWQQGGVPLHNYEPDSALITEQTGIGE